MQHQTASLQASPNRHRMIKVWPLRSGLQGLDANGDPCVLTPGTAGWMLQEEAAEAEQRGDLQCMPGLRPSDLKSPYEQQEDEPPAEKRAPRRKKRGYNRRDLIADDPGPPVPFIHSPSDEN